MDVRLVLRWIALTAAAVAGGFLLYSYVGLMFWGAQNRAGAATNPNFYGAIGLIAVGGFEPGFVAGLAVATAFYRRRLWSILLNGTIAAWFFVILNVWLTFAVP